MSFPSFFGLAPTITVTDPLAAFLGAPADGRLTYFFTDAVRLAGHSCPTVAGAWLMTAKALAALWPDETPERGAIRVRLPEAQDEGVAGVVATVAGLITGAAGTGGFKGIAGRFGRANLMEFDADIPATMAFTRTDTGASVLVAYDPGMVAPDPEMRPALQRILAGAEQPGDGATFARCWQDRVRRILVDHADDPDMVRVSPV